MIHDHHPGYISWERSCANEQRLRRQRHPPTARARRARAARCARGSCAAAAAGGRCRPATSAGRAATTTARTRAPTTSTRPLPRRSWRAVVDELVAAAAAGGARARADRARARRRRRGRRSPRARDPRASSCASSAPATTPPAPSARSTSATPSNRLVARSLETRWEAKLRELADAEAELAEHRPPARALARADIEALARDLPAPVGRAERPSHRDRKRLLRALIADVTLTSAARRPRAARRDPLALGRQPSSTRLSDPRRRADAPAPRPQAIELITPLARPTTPTRSSPRSSTPPACAPAPAARSTRPPCAGSADATRIPVPATLVLADDELTVQPGRRAPRRLRRRRLRLDPPRPARRPPRARQPPRIPFAPDVEQACRERVADSVHIPTPTQNLAAGGAV